MENIKFVIEKSSRIQKLIDDLYEKMPEIESARGKLVTEAIATGLGELRINVTDYVKRMRDAGMSEIAFYLEGSKATIRRLNFASKEGGNGMSQLIVGDGSGRINTYLQYDEVNPWGRQ